MGKRARLKEPSESEVNHMGSRLKEILKRKGLTGLDLQYKARISPNLIWGIERYGYKPRQDVAVKIARALGVEVPDIWPELKKGKSGG